MAGGRFGTAPSWFAYATATVSSRRPLHELAICAIFREEAPFLEEWLKFHTGIGTTHFFLYNNFSTDSFRTVLRPWIARGMVTLYDWPHEVGQLAAYEHCARHHWRDARWIAFIDIDEFLFSPSAIDVRPILREYDDIPAILVYGFYFGSAGHRTRPAGPLLSAFTRRARVETMKSGKTIANPRMIREVSNVHVFDHLEGEALDTDRRTLATGGSSPVFDRLRFNHYWSRSIEDLHAKVRRGDASAPGPRDLAAHLAHEATLNELEDLSILPIAAAIRGESWRARHDVAPLQGSRPT